MWCRPIHARPIAWITVAVCVLPTVVAPGRLDADDIKFDKYWHRQVTIVDVHNGQIIYTDNFGNERVKEMDDVRGLKIPAFEELGKAQDALDAGDVALAVTLLTRVRNQVRRPSWLKHWVEWQTMNALARLGRPTKAVIAYLNLDRDRADAFYLKHPPLVVLGGATDAQKRDVRQRLTAALANLRPEARLGAQAMLQRIAPPAAEPSRDEAPEAVTTPVAPKPVIDPELDSAVVLPKAIVHDDQITILLRAGEFEQALDNAGQILAGKTVSRISMRWYQRGMASLALAERSTDPAVAGRLYRDAGLDFMRVVVYFPTGVYRAPALVEAGVVHHRIGQPSRARQLYEQAAQGIRPIEPEMEPKYHQRLQQLLKAVHEEPNAADKRAG